MTINYMNIYANEARPIVIDFAADLATGETLSGIASVKIAQLDNGVWTDVTSQFYTSGAQVQANTQAVIPKIAAASGTDQAAGEYTLTVAVNTSDSNVKIDHLQLIVLRPRTDI